MKVTQVVFDHAKALTKYPYHFRIDIPRDNMTLIEDVVDWAHSTGFRCAVLPGAVYVPTAEDAALFILRWA